MLINREKGRGALFKVSFCLLFRRFIRRDDDGLGGVGARRVQTKFPKREDHSKDSGLSVQTDTIGTYKKEGKRKVVLK